MRSIDETDICLGRTVDSFFLRYCCSVLGTDRLERKAVRELRRCDGFCDLHRMETVRRVKKTMGVLTEGMCRS